MSKSLQESFECALASASSDSPLDRLVQASLLTSAHQFVGLRLRVPVSSPSLTFKLADASAPGSLIGANDAADMLTRIQKAVARLAKARRNRWADAKSLRPSDFAIARLNVASGAPGSLQISLLPDVTQSVLEDEGALPVERGSWAEVGAAELLRALPESPNDDASIESLVSASPVIRRAVADLIMNRANPGIDLSFKLERRSGEPVSAFLSVAQAKVLASRLAEVQEEREIIRMAGRLDGVRTRRQIFYFEPAGGSPAEIHGFVDESLVQAVKQHIDSNVQVALESFILRSPSGKRSQRRYRLIEVGDVFTELPPAADIDTEDDE